jgi:nucleotide-binding universal stress UspA family protein
MPSTSADRPEPPVTGEGAVFSDVLCALDGTHESIAAVGHAAALIGSGGRMTLLVVTSYESDGERRSPAIGPGSVHAMLDRAVEICREAGVKASVEVDPASPPSQIVLDWAEGHGLLAIGAPATSWFGGLFAGGVAVTAEGWFDTPLLVARAAPAEGRFASPIVVASDGLEGSDELVRLAGRLARAQGAGLILVHVVGHQSSERPERIVEQARSMQLAMGDAFQERIEVGHARSAIVEAAGAVGASLVVMSSRRLRGLRVIGSVSRRVVHQGHCSVLLVPPEHLLPGRGS